MPNAVNLTNKRFGSLIALNPTTKRSDGCIMWFCKCDCGKTKTIVSRNLNGGKSTSCGACDKNESIKLGDKFGKLTTTKRLEPSKDGRSALWLCVCECGETEKVYASILRCNKNIDCGCKMKELLKEYRSKPNWKDVVGFEELYMVSDRGEVVSFAHRGTFKGARLLKPNVDKRGYARIGLCKNNKRHNLFVSRIVAEAFIENPNNKPHVNHIDCDPLNNSASNLEWCTPKENVYHAMDNGRHRVPRSPIVATCIDSGETFYFGSQKEAARALGVHQSRVHRTLCGVKMKNQKYQFRRA